MNNRRHLKLSITLVAVLVAVSWLALGNRTGPSERRVAHVDGMPLDFVPAGPFQMGSDSSDSEAGADEKPLHTVFLDAFWIDQHEVTNAMFRQCVEAGACDAPQHPSRYGRPEYDDHPILGVTWPQANNYCAWAGRRLPTEAEWEKAARGPDGRRYPWGNEPPDSSRLNYAGETGDTRPVGSYPAGASPYGALDMAGNAWEWVADAYDPGYYSDSPEANPTGGQSANQRVIRGGSWTTEAGAVRAANRFWAFPGRNDTDGFRCAVS